jgi:hypothetical protein
MRALNVCCNLSFYNGSPSLHATDNGKRVPVVETNLHRFIRANAYGLRGCKKWAATDLQNLSRTMLVAPHEYTAWVFFRLRRHATDATNSVFVCACVPWQLFMAPALDEAYVKRQGIVILCIMLYLKDVCTLGYVGCQQEHLLL